MRRITDHKQYILNNVKHVWHDRLQSNCWIWQRSCHASGYSLISVNGCYRYGHRVAYVTFVGPIPEGLCVLHKCDIYACCNPDHLYADTQLQNIKDRDDRNRLAPLNGECNGLHKVTAPQVIEMRLKYATGQYTYTALAADYGISRQQVTNIVKRKWWAHL